jgi:hypothetical protein
MASGDAALVMATSGIWMRFTQDNGSTHYLWRAVDQKGVVLGILVQTRRDRIAAIRFFTGCCELRGIVIRA